MAETDGMLSLRAQDIQTGLQDYDVSEFKTLLELGWAARLALHLRASGPVPERNLAQIAQHLFGANPWGYDQALVLLQDAEFVRVAGKDDTRLVVPSNIPYFNELYPKLDNVAESRELNEAENLTVDLLSRAAEAPAPLEDVVDGLGADQKLASSVLEIGRAGSYLDVVDASGSNYLISPLYFSENAAEFAAAVEAHGQSAVASVIKKLRSVPGCPLEMIIAGQIGDQKLEPEELDAARALLANAMTQPPGITSRGKLHQFIFTPRLGTKKIEIIEKEVYERAIEILSAIRFGQHYASWQLRMPTALLKVLLDGRTITPPQSVRDQYVNLAIRRIVDFDPPPPKPFNSVRLVNTEENRRAVQLAIEMLESQSGEIGRIPDQEVVKLMQSSGLYVEFIRGVGHVKRKTGIRSEREAARDVNTILEMCMKGT
jgi:hypothetical protein